MDGRTDGQTPQKHYASAPGDHQHRAIMINPNQAHRSFVACRGTTYVTLVLCTLFNEVMLSGEIMVLLLLYTE